MNTMRWVLRRSLYFLFLCAVLSASLNMGISTVAQAAQDGGTLSLPIACEPGQTCWIPNYVDHKPGPGVLDYTCGDATYDAAPGGMHKGTDFAVRDMAAVRQGIAVVAAAPGVVLGMRDGVPDAVYSEKNGAAVKNKECGNGVRLAHDGGLTTQYCHLRNGSVRVKAGERVGRGQALGLVGLSGRTEFPHLHFQVGKDKRILDPFAGIDRKKDCGVGENALWDAHALAKLTYQPTAIYHVGFAPGKPSRADMRSGRYGDGALGATAPAMVLWAEFFRVRGNDEITMTITGPNGQRIHQNVLKIEADKAYYYAFSGLRLKTFAWPEGAYVGDVTLNRQGKLISAHQTIQVQ